MSIIRAGRPISRPADPARIAAVLADMSRREGLEPCETVGVIANHMHPIPIAAA